MAAFRTRHMLGLVVAGVFLFATNARGANTLYDMNRFLQEAHPFQNPAMAPAPGPAPTVQRAPSAARTRRALPARSPASARPSLPESKPEVTDDENTKVWFSEVRSGVIKHAVSLIGNEPKETGIDGNLEILFHSPDWLKFLWSPRPHIGTSFNTSSNNTDVVYGGITWESKFWKSLFFNFSFGVAVHNGELEYDAKVVFPSYAGRRREMGCRALFRESFELGWIFAKRHGVSAMWSHYSHGGICGGQNEGLDNLGVRYGYRF